jgi:hypothetical protein
MSDRVDLLWLADNQAPPRWPLGKVWPVSPQPAAVDQEIRQRLPDAASQAWLFWDARLGAPDPDRVQATLAKPGDVWHAGLRVGMASRPALIDFVEPI